MKTTFHNNRQCGMTLVEVILGLVILVILGITAITSLFYPRHLTTTSATRRLAVDAATDHLERLFATDYQLIPSGDQSVLDMTTVYNINGQTVTSTVYTAESRSDPIPGGGGATFDYLYLKVEVAYPGGTNEPVILETYRSPMK